MSATRDVLKIRFLDFVDVIFGFLRGRGTRGNDYLLVDRAELESKGFLRGDISITALQHGTDTSILQFTINPVPHFALRGNKGATLRWNVGECRVVLFKMRPTAFREDIKIIFARFSSARLHNGGLVTICRWCTLCHLARISVEIILVINPPHGLPEFTFCLSLYTHIYPPSSLPDLDLC